MSQPTREEVQAFIDALRYGMKVSHAPAFLIALAEGWLENELYRENDPFRCLHEWGVVSPEDSTVLVRECKNCGATETTTGPQTK